MHRIGLICKVISLKLELVVENQIPISCTRVNDGELNYGYSFTHMFQVQNGLTRQFIFQVT